MKLRNAVLVAGSLLATSCGYDETINVKEAPAPALTGVFVDSPVQGLSYNSESFQNGSTTANGEFSYFRGDFITFSIGELTFPGVPASAVLTPLDMFGTDNVFNQPVVNTLRLLQALDTDGDPSNGISISDSAADAAEMLLQDSQSVADFFNRPAEEFAADVEAWLPAAGGGSDTLVDYDAAILHFVEYLETEYGTLLTNAFNADLISGTLFHAFLDGNTPVLASITFTPSGSDPLSGSFIYSSDETDVAGEYNFDFGRRALALTASDETVYMISRSFNTVNQVYSLCFEDDSAGALTSLVAACDAADDAKDNLLVVSQEQAEIELAALEELANSVEPALLEEFDTDTSTFFSSGYKRLSDDPNSGPLYFKTGGSPLLDAELGQLTLEGARFTIGNAAVDPGQSTSSSDTFGTGIYNISQGFTISFDVISHNGGGSFNMYVDNNTTSQGNSVHGAASKFYGLSINDENLPQGQRFVYTYEPGTDVSGLPADDPDARILDTSITNSFFQLRTDSSGRITIDNLKIETVADAVDVEIPEEPEEPEEPTEPEQPEIPNSNLPLNYDFVGVTADIFSEEFDSLTNAQGETLPMYTRTGGSVTVVEDGLQIDSGRFTIGNSTPDIETSSEDQTTSGVLDLSRPYKVVMDIVYVSDSEGNNNFQIYVDNNTSSSGKSIHGSASKFYSELINTLEPGTTLEVEGLLATQNSFLQLRTESGGVVIINNLRIEYIDALTLADEDFETSTELFFTPEYKSIPDDASTALYSVTGGGSGLTITDGQLSISSARFSWGNRIPDTDTSADDTSTSGIYDLSRPYKVSFDLISADDPDGDNHFQLYVDNNTSSSGKSIHGSASKFYQILINEMPVGERIVIEGLEATASSFLQLRTESGGTVVIDNLAIEYEPLETGPSIFSCEDEPTLYFCDDFAQGDLSNWELLATADNTDGAVGQWDTVEDDSNTVLRYTAGSAGGEIIRLTDAAMASIPDTADYFIEARIRPRQNSTTANKQLYLLGRYDSEGNWYGGGLNLQNSTSSTRAEVAISTDGSISRPVQASTPLILGTQDGTDGVWYRVRFDLQGDLLTVYLDGEEMGSVADSSYTAKGLIGMFTNNRSFEIDDFKVGDPTVKPVQLTLDYKSPKWQTTTTSDPLYVYVTAVQNDGVTEDSFSATSSDNAVVSVTVDASNVVLTPVGAGTATVTFVSGSDDSLRKTIDVSVEEGFVMPVSEYGDISSRVSPVINAQNAYIDTSLSITFDSAPTLGEVGEVRVYATSDNSIVDVISLGGEIDNIGYQGQDRVRRVNYRPLTISGNTLTVKLHTAALDYDSDYYVAIGEGVVTGTTLNGVDFTGLGANAGWQFSTKEIAPAGTDITVDDDGNADFRTVQGALNYVMQHVGRDDAATITIKSGQYNELLYLRNKNNLTIQGEDRAASLVYYDNYESFNGGTGGSEPLSTGTPGGGRSVFLVEGADNLLLNNFTLKNSHIRDNVNSNQAETIYFSSAGRLTANNMNFYSEQDTLLLKGYAWFYNSLVAGNVDFIWGYATAALFEESEIRSIGDSKYGADQDSPGGYVLQARVQNADDPGFVFLNSEFTSGPGPLGNLVLDDSTYIARSGGNSNYFDNVTLINNKFGPHIAGVGWAYNGINGQPAPNPDPATANAGWREYGSMDLEGNPLDLSARAGGYMLTQDEAVAFSTRAAVFAGYNSGTGWTPSAVEAPTIEEDLTDLGFAGYNFEVTGGAGGTVVTVDNGLSLINALDTASAANVPVTIYVDGTITDANSGGSGRSIEIKDMDNVSIIGVADRGEFDGIGISIRRANNIIIQNLKIHHVLTGGKDAISIEGDDDGSTTSRIWIDHNELYSTLDVDKDYYDGLIDSKSGARYITISYNYLHDHWKGSLHGHTDNDTSNTERFITFHHNRFENIESRLPLFRFGYGHLYNNYYNNISSSGMNSRMGAELQIQNNVFENTKNPIVSFYSEQIGYWNTSGNLFGDGVTWSTPADGDVSAGPDAEPTSSYEVPYDYQLDPADVVKNKVINNAGVGKIDQSDLEIPAIEQGGGEGEGNGEATDVSLPFAEDFSAADKDSFFSADYKSLPEDSSAPLYNVTGGGSGIVLENGEISLTSARFTLGESNPGTDTSADDTSVSGVFDLSQPYRIVVDVISTSDPDADNNFQIYVDNNTSSSSKSHLGGSSKFFQTLITELSLGTLTVEGPVATESSFIQLRTESGGTVVLDNLRIEYLD